MKTIYIMREGSEVITARDTMNHAIVTAMNRIAANGYQCEEFDYGETETIIEYRDFNAHETRIMVIEAINYWKGI